jgi:hypothetical protein
MKLTEYRDLAVIGGAIAAGAALAYLALDDLMSRRARTVAIANRSAAKVPLGVHYDLYEVGAGPDGTSKGTWIRPASEQEAKSSEAAEQVDDGPGVFAVVEGGVHVLPGTPEWDHLIGPMAYTGSAPVKYYRVG